MNAPACTLTTAGSGIGFRKCIALWVILSLLSLIRPLTAGRWAADVIGAQASTSSSGKFKTMRKVARNCLV